MILTRGGVEDARLEAKAKDTKKIRGQGQGQPFRGQTLSRPRTGMLEAKAKDTSASALPKKKKKKKVFTKIFQAISKKKKKKKRSSQKFFKRSPQKNVFQKIFQALHKILTIQKIVLSSSRGQANFRGLEASRPRPRTSKCVLEGSTSDSNYSLGQHKLMLWNVDKKKTEGKINRGASKVKTIVLHLIGVDSTFLDLAIREIFTVL